MSIRTKTFAIIGSVFVLSCVITWVATVTLVQSQYVKIEATDVTDDTSRTVDALKNSVDQLAIKIPDWSSWDDAYTYAKDHNQAFVTSNVQNSALKNLGLNFMIFIGADQKIILFSGVDVTSGATIPIAPELLQALKPGSPLLASDATSAHQGLLKTSTYPLIMVSRPILRTDGTGPLAGTLIFAQYLSPTAVAKLVALTRLDVSYDPAVAANGQASPAAVGTSTTTARSVAINSNTIYGYQLIDDIYGHPLLVAKVTDVRTIYQKTQHTLLFYVIVILSVSLSSILITTYTTDRIARQRRVIDSNDDINSEIKKRVADQTREVKIEQARLEASINSLDIGFLMTDSNLRLVTANRTFRKLFNGKFKTREVAKFTITDIAATLDGKVDLIKVLHDSLDNNKVINIKDIDFDGKILHLFCGPILTYSDGSVKAIGCVVLLEDVTEATVQARSKDEFFSIASHELRTPLTAIRGNSSMMMQYYKEIFKDPELKEMLSDINEASVRLITIVNDFLDVSRIEQGKINYNLTEVSISKIIESVIHDLKSGQTEAHVPIIVDHQSLEKLPSIIGDSDRVKQIIYNLVGNAVKFTAKGSVTISADKIGNMLKTSITDTGKGIDPASQKLLFHKFQQANNSLLTRSTAKGTGLGLYISKLLVEDMGGDISLDHSELGVGSTFSFTLPIATKQLLKKIAAENIKKKTELDSQTGITKAVNA